MRSNLFWRCSVISSTPILQLPCRASHRTPMTLVSENSMMCRHQGIRSTAPGKDAADNIQSLYPCYYKYANTEKAIISGHLSVVILRISHNWYVATCLTISRSHFLSSSNATVAKIKIFLFYFINTSSNKLFVWYSNHNV